MNLVQWTLSGTYDADKPVLIDGHNPKRSLSRGRATDLVSRLAGCFPEGSTVCIHLANDILYPIIVLGILASGCIYAGSQITYTQLELEHQLLKSNAKYIITSSDYFKIVSPAVKAAGKDIEIIRFTDILRGAPGAAPEGQEALRALHHLLSDVEQIPLQDRLQQISANSVAKLTATSGTTGLPKLAEASHTTAIAESRASEEEVSDKPYEIRRLYCLPISHAFAFPDMMINSLRLGYTSYYLKRFGDAFAHLVNDFTITEVMVVPSMLLTLEEQASEDMDAKADLQGLKLVLCGGAPLSKSLSDRFLRLFHNPPKLIQAWGMTECGMISAFKYDDTDADDTTSVGRLNDNLEIKMSEDHASILGDGRRVAELWVKGPQVMSGYRNDPEITASTLNTDGWLKTGDVGYVDDAGRIFLVGRAKDFIKVDGFSVSPFEIEVALQELPEVREATVVASQKSEDEHPVVFIVANNIEVSKPTAATIKKGLLTRLARHKVVKCEVKFVEEIPKNESGKVLRDELLKQVEK